MFGSKPNKEQQAWVTMLAEKMAAEAQVKAALEEILRLRSQVDRLQDALVATTAPRAYEDMKSDQTVQGEPDQTKKYKREAEINAELLWRMEQPTFKDGDDMIAMLTGDADFMKSKSVHGNSES
jgi:hypothetical protein